MAHQTRGRAWAVAVAATGLGIAAWWGLSATGESGPPGLAKTVDQPLNVRSPGGATADIRASTGPASTAANAAPARGDPPSRQKGDAASFVLEGCVRSYPKGLPIAGAHIRVHAVELATEDRVLAEIPIVGWPTKALCETKTDAEGRYRLEGSADGAAQVVVGAPGYMAAVSIAPSIARLDGPDHWLRRAATLKLLVSDSVGNPVPGAELLCYEDKSLRGVPFDRLETDEAGCAMLPLAEAHGLLIRARGFTDVRTTAKALNRDQHVRLGPV